VVWGGGGGVGDNARKWKRN